MEDKTIADDENTMADLSGIEWDERVEVEDEQIESKCFESLEPMVDSGAASFTTPLIINDTAKVWVAEQDRSKSSLLPRISAHSSQSLLPLPALRLMSSPMSSLDKDCASSDGNALVQSACADDEVD